MFEPLDQSESEEHTSSRRHMRLIWAVVIVVALVLVTILIV